LGKIEMTTVVEADARRPRHDSASIVELKDGRLLLAWMEHIGGEMIGHDQAPCDIACMTSADSGRTWKDHRILVRNDPGDVNIHFPCFLRLRSGDILLYYQRRHLLAEGALQKSTSYVCRSSDEAKSFSTPWKHDVIRDSSMSGDVLMQMSSGRILLGTSDTSGPWCARTADGRALDHDVSGCCYSDDEGRTWGASAAWASLPLRGAAEPHIVEVGQGRLLMYMRTQMGAVFQSESADGGETWSKPQTTGLKAPESMSCLAKIPRTDDLLLIWNDSLYDPEFDHCGKRTPLTVAISRNQGRTWENFKNLETDPVWEFTNPFCHFTSRGKVIITYVASRMDNPNPPGRLGRSCMPLRAAIADVEWFYE
jgi:sialidase-1